jgi:hypothetical protein
MECHDPVRQPPQSRKATSKPALSCIVALCVLCAGTSLISCRRHRKIEIVSRTVINGVVNNAAFKGTVNATIKVGSGGHSSCTYEQLPPQFNPGTIGTHA